ncbi:MAG: putative sugar O-methyltransferase [Kiritimatiellae bacterium]|nr:putative sugar O-methyltransferase [Kiritimatiellia bacterium]
MNPSSAQALLKLMTDDIRTQQTIHQPTAFWSTASRDIYDELTTHGFQNFRSLPSTRSYFVPTYGPPGNTLTPEDVQQIEEAILANTERQSKKHSTLMHMIGGEMWALADYRVYRAADDLSQAPNLAKLSESKVGNPSEHFCLEERWFSRSFLNYILGIVFLKQHIQTADIKRVIEVGGGFGTLGEILLQAGDYAYVDVDIPPTAAVASYYLSNQPGANLLSYAETRGAESIPFPDPGTQLVLCPWQLPSLCGKADLFVNFISFQEMEPHVVQDYLAHVDRLSCRFVLLRNLREGKQRKTEEMALGVETPTLGSDYDHFMPNYRLIATNVIPFGFRTIDGFNSELRLYERKG